MSMASGETVVLTERLQQYMEAHSSPPDDVAKELINRTRQLGQVDEMRVPPVQGTLLTILARLLDARLVVDVGTFTGYSALCLARGMPSMGRVITCDISAEWTSIARQAWASAGVDHMVDLRLGPARDTLASLPPEQVIDLAFIDADKVGYIDYWKELVPRIRVGGLLVVDNVFYYGEVVDEHAKGNAAAMRAFNDHARADPRVDLVMLPIADGMTLARKHADDQRT
jgi:caffeoyl-CoA O-methyltransferase